MDLTSAVVGLQQSQVMGAVQIKVARMILDDQQSQGAAALKLMQAAENSVNASSNDVVSAANGLGGQINMYA